MCAGGEGGGGWGAPADRSERRWRVSPALCLPPAVLPRPAEDPERGETLLTKQRVFPFFKSMRTAQYESQMKAALLAMALRKRHNGY